MRLIALSAGVAALVIVGTLYLCREPLSEALARNWLRDHGVASGLRIRSISLSGLSAEVRLGNPADPDLTVERLAVGYALEGPWSGAPVSVQTRWVRLVRPRIKLRLVGTRLDFGGLQRLVADLSKGPPGVGPQPDIMVEDGAIRLLTVAGEVDARANVTLKAGALTSARATVAPFSLASAQGRLSGQGGDLAVVRRGGGFSVTAASGPVSMSNGVDRARVAGLRLTGTLPGLPEGGGWAGAVDLTLTASGAATAARGMNASDGRLTARLQGRVNATQERQTMTGGLNLSAELGSILGGGVGARNVAAGLRLPHLTVERRGAAISLIGDGEADLGVLALSGGGGQGALRTGPIRLTRLKLSSRGGPLAVSGVADGGLEGEGGLAPAQAARLARSIPVLAGQPAYLGATQRALRRFRLAAPRWRAAFDAGTARVTLLSPIRVDAASAAHLSLSTPAGGVLIGPSRAEGSATLAVDGGGLPTLRVQVADAAVGPGRLQADVAARGALDLAAVHGARFDIRGRVVGAGAHYRFDLTADAPFSAERLAFDPNAITGLSGGLRRGGAPLFEIGPRGWTASGRLQGVQGDVAGFDAGVRAADASVQAHGGKGLDGLALDLERAQVLDQAKPLRFMPLGFTGTVSLAGGALTGDLKAATRAGRPIGVIHLRHDLAAATGRADIDAGGLAFSPHALQPAELSPLAAFAKDADGAASFRGWFGWAPGKPPASGGVLTARGLKFTSPVGPVLGIDADLRFTSLAPLVSAPDQVMTVQLVKAVTPLSGLSTRFDFTDKAVSIDTAAGAVARGRIRLEPMVVPLTPGARVKGALVLDHVNIGDIIAASTLADTVKMDAVIDGRIPFEYSPAGLTIQQGRLQAVAPGRVSISRKALTGAAGGGAALTADAATAQANFGQDIAYQAMENLAFDQLDAAMDTQPGDRLGILFHIKGRHDPPQRARATIAVADVLRGQPLAKPIALPSDTKIDLTLDTSLNFGELVQALLQTWRDSTTATVPAHSAPVQAAPPTVTPK